jgi:hypothetical protein
MKDWPFFLAILALLILLLPMYEGYESDITNGLYFIKCGSYYCTMQGNIMVCNKTIPEDKDLFLIQKVNASWMASGGYSIRPNPTLNSNTANCADEGYRVICDREYVNTWETFKITSIGDGYYTIKGGNNTNWDKQFCNGDIGQFLCKKTMQGESEKFQIISQKKYSKDKLNDMYANVDMLKGQLIEIGKSTSDLEPIVTGIENMHRDLLGQSIQSQLNINKINNRQNDVKNEITKINDSIPGLRNKDQEIKVTRDIISNKIGTLTDTELPKIQTEINELNKQYDLLISARNFHIDKDVPVSNMSENETTLVQKKANIIAPNPANLPTGVYSLQSRQNTYCSDLENGFNCTNNVMSPGTTDMWKLINLGDGNYNLKGGRANKYCAINNDNDALICNSSDATKSIKFQLGNSDEPGYQDLYESNGEMARVKFSPIVPSSDPFV